MERLTVSLLLVMLAGAPTRQQETLDWWQTTVLYQIYPRSFKDSNGDGIGDLNGIKEKLDYIKETGIGAVWISPIYKSPMVDFGYDISDFRDIDPVYGTMEDFISLKDKMKELGIKLVMDFVPNHSSDQHEWFKMSVKKVEPYTDYYVWVDGKIDPKTGERQPPNNWISVFGGSAWKWNEERGQYYLHQFAVAQPDLNYRNPAVVKEMNDVLRFWLELGVDGFRIDAVPFLFEDDQLQDEQRSDVETALPTDHSYLQHDLTQNLEETYDLVKQWRQLVDQESAKDGITRAMMIEAYAPIENTMKYYGNSSEPGGHFPFNFLLITELRKGFTAQNVEDVINQWMDNMPPGGWPNWVVGNHDNKRVASRFGKDLVDAVNMLVMMLPGTAVTYNGEEIGMEDTFISWEQTKDPQALNAGEERYELFTRDPERTPFQWNDSTSAGFSTNPQTWLPVNPNYKTLNLEAQLLEPWSHYQVYKHLVATRSADTIQKGGLFVKALSDAVLAFVRELEGSDTYVVVMNLGKERKIADLTVFDSLYQSLTVHIPSSNSGFHQGQSVATSKINLPPGAALVLISQHQ
ncbi:maltase A1 [Anabrus simplex]|uniref:maltase A1 n=1 Tax=Anabrus simplex TaxID=316456 RepID=UPI0035A38F07